MQYCYATRFSVKDDFGPECRNAYCFKSGIHGWLKLMPYGKLIQCKFRKRFVRFLR